MGYHKKIIAAGEKAERIGGFLVNADHLAPLIETAEKVMEKETRMILAIDGMAAAGKTTAAAMLSGRWGAPVVHMDDFFLPQELRTGERLYEPGGNVHYERFMEEVLPHLYTGEGFAYRRFDCGIMGYAGHVPVAAAPVVIVEGAYAMHPRFGRYWDVGAFFAIFPEEQERRIRARNGDERWELFRTRWIPMESRYHEAFHTAERADIIIKTPLG